MDRAFDDASAILGTRPRWDEIAVGMGLAGAGHALRRADFLALEPGFGRLVVDSDAFTSLLGAHQRQPGAVLVVGTGSIGLGWWPDGHRRQVGGWGFPSGDEGSGAWLGLQLANLVQRELDGRAPSTALGRHVMQVMDEQAGGVKDWLAQANQTRFAALGPLVIAHAKDVEAQALLEQAAGHLARMAEALDPQCELPFALCGGLASSLLPWLPADLRERLRSPAADSSQGAIWMVQRDHGNGGGA